MKLFLFSASVFYLLGLKLSSHLDILPHITSHSEKTESTISTSTKPQLQKLETKSLPVQKDSIHGTENGSGQLTAPLVKISEK